MKQIFLNRDMVTLVSDEDYEYLFQFSWTVHECGRGKIYAARMVYNREKKRCDRVLMHREITKAPKNRVADHRDGDGLNNQRFNLRVCTQGENIWNKGCHSSSGFKGVSLDGRSYRARIENQHIGSFKTPEAAARAYDEEASKRYGDFARVNFPIFKPEEKAHVDQSIPF